MTEALVLIDLQNDYFPGGTMELDDADGAVEQAALLLQSFREKGLLIFHIQHIAKRPGATFFLPGTAGAELHRAVQPSASEASWSSTLSEQLSRDHSPRGPSRRRSVEAHLRGNDDPHVRRHDGSRRS